MNYAIRIQRQYGASIVGQVESAFIAAICTVMELCPDDEGHTLAYRESPNVPFARVSSRSVPGEYSPVVTISLELVSASAHTSQLLASLEEVVLELREGRDQLEMGSIESVVDVIITEE